MLNNISWASYVYAISIILIIYYAIVLILYYRKDLQGQSQKLKAGFNLYSASVDTTLHKKAIDINKDFSNGEDQNNAIQELLLSLQSLIKNGASRNFQKEELLLALKLKLQDHADLKDSISGNTINNYIIAAFENNCSIHLNEAEVSALWKK